MKLDRIMIGKRIRKIRVAKGLSQKQMAELLDCDAVYYGKLERADKRLTLEWTVSIADVLDVSIDSLIGRENIPASELELHSIVDGCSNYERHIIIETCRQLRLLLKNIET